MRVRLFQRWPILACLVFVGLSMMSCREAHHSVDVHDVEDAVWSAPEIFCYDNEDSLSKRDIAIVVRYGEGYVADSVALRILTISPDSMVYEEPFALHIPRIKEVRPAEQTFLYRSRVVLGRKGEYQFRITPERAVEGITSVGIVIDEADN